MSKYEEKIKDMLADGGGRTADEIVDAVARASQQETVTEVHAVITKMLEDGALVNQGGDRYVLGRTCSWCGMTEQDNGSPLIGILVIAAYREEGHSEVTRLACDEDLIKQADALVKLGYGIHAHGGICFLEDTRCPGAKTPEACPTPEEQYVND